MLEMVSGQLNPFKRENLLYSLLRNGSLETIDRAEPDRLVQRLDPP